MTIKTYSAIASAGAITALLVFPAKQVLAQSTIRASVHSSGAESAGQGSRVSLSGDGRYAAFYSDAANLVDGDGNGVRDIFVHDRLTGQTRIVSVSATGAIGNGKSDRPSISDDGRFVAFTSDADNLAGTDANALRDIFVQDRDADADGIFDEVGAINTTRVSVSSAGVEANGRCNMPATSGDGRHVAFRSVATNLFLAGTAGADHIFVNDRQTATTALVCADSAGLEGNTGSDRPALSIDGRFVVFHNDADNLVPGDTPTFDILLCPACVGVRDIFVHDRDPDQNGVFDEANGVTERVSLATSGTPANVDCTRPVISADGRHAAFRSAPDNLVLSDGNGLQDVFVRDRLTNTTTRASVSSAGAQTVDGNSDLPSISGDGRYVAFSSKASNLVPGDSPPFDSVLCPACTGLPDVFVHDRDPDANGLFDEGNGVTTRASVSTGSIAGDGPSDRPWMAEGGRFVGFVSDATNLVAGDVNAHADIFVHDLLTSTTVNVNVSSAGVQGNFGSDRVSISADGRFVALRSKADNLIAGDTPSFDNDTCPACTGDRDVFAA